MMACSVHQFGEIVSVPDIIHWLCPHICKNLSEQSWSDDWGFDADVEMKSYHEPPSNFEEVSSKPPRCEVSWLSECIVDVSPMANLMVVAYKNRFAILSGHWEADDIENDSLQMVLNYKGTTGDSPGDEIKSLLCLPLVSQKMSSSGNPDWTCIFVGLNSGHVTMYTENGVLLLSQLFENSPVLRMRCRTVTSGSAAKIYDTVSEEFILLYQHCILTIDGFSLYQTLTACRNQAAKAAASGRKIIDAPVLNCKKWELSRHQGVSDCISAGLSLPILLDYMIHLSYTNGYYQALSSKVPNALQLITVGSMNFVNFWMATEAMNVPQLSVVVKHFTSKIFSAASGVLFGKSGAGDAASGSSNSSLNLDNILQLKHRASLVDSRRQALSLVLSPNKRLIAITDDFGRVSLIDILNSSVVRMWKGYRDAQCAWMNCVGDWGGTKREVNFLVIYAPRRGLLEVWPPQQGVRVAAFNVPKMSRLIYNSHTLLGTNSVRTMQYHIFPVMFITPDGALQELIIPFHLALGKTSKRARDLHLLKTLVSLLKTGPEAEILATLKEMQTTEVHSQALINLIAMKHSDSKLLRGVLDILTPLYPFKSELKGDDNSSHDFEGLLLAQHLVRLSQLLEFFEAVASLYESQENNQLPDEDFVQKELAKYLILTQDETSEVLSHVTSLKISSSQKRVVFADEMHMRESSFIHCWEVTGVPFIREAVNTVPVKMKGNLAHNKKLRLGSFLFGWPWSQSNADTFRTALAKSGCFCLDLLSCELLNWSSSEVSSLQVLQLATVVYSISCWTVDEIICEISQRSKWWTDVRDRLGSWTNIGHAYLVALVCRGIHAILETYQHEAMDVTSSQQEFESEPNVSYKSFKFPSSSLNEWEGLSMEMVEWNLIINQLKTLLPLETFLSLKPLQSSKSWEALEISIKQLYNRGSGHVSEIIAQWFVHSGISVSNTVKVINASYACIEKDKVGNDIELVADELDEIDIEDSSLMVVKDQLVKVGKVFPHSVTPYAIIANEAWELGAAWNKATDNLENLQAAIEILSLIGNSYIGHGIALMMWETWICLRIQTLTKLIERCVNNTKQELSKRLTDVTLRNLPRFLKITASLLDFIMQMNIECEVQKPPLVAYDDFWRGIDNSQSLVGVALCQKVTSYDLVFYHYQLTLVLYLMAEQDTWRIKPFSCFEENDQGVFFNPLSTTWTAIGHSGVYASKTRLNFLKHIITIAVANLPDQLLETQQTVPSVKIAIELGRSWSISVDTLHRHHVCELYSFGHDTLAEELINTVTNRRMLGSHLVQILAQRLQHQINMANNKAEAMSVLAPLLTDWLKTLKPDMLRSPLVTLSTTLRLATRTMNLLPESSSDYKMASAMHDTFSAMINDESCTS